MDAWPSGHDSRGMHLPINPKPRPDPPAAPDLKVLERNSTPPTILSVIAWLDGAIQ
jgi:hypothetical protein